MNNTSLGLWGHFDSRTSSHIFSEQNCFTSYTEAYNSQLVTVSSLNYISVVGYRSVSFHAKLPSGQIILVILWNVLHVLSLGTNLVSLGILQHKGASYSSWGDGIVISISGQELFFFFFFVQKFITWCLITVRSRLSTISSLHGPQGPDCPITGRRHYQYQRRNLT